MPLTLWNFGNVFYRGAQTSVMAFYEGLLRGDIAGLEHIPKKGAYLVAANHLSFIDPPAIGSAITRPMYFFARNTLFKPGLANWVLTALHAIPYKRDSEGDAGAMKRILRLLKEGEGLLMFIEGTRSHNGELQTPKPGLGLLACKTGVPVIPARIFGSHQALGRSNKELCLHARSSLVFGPPMQASEYDPGPQAANRYQEASNRVFQKLSDLKPIIPPCI